MCGDPLAKQLRFRKARKSKKSFPSQQIYYYFIFRWLLFELHSRSRLESRLNDVSCEINYVQIEYGISRFVLFIFGISLFLQPNCFFEKHRATSNVRMCTVQHGTGKKKFAKSVNNPLVPCSLCRAMRGVELRATDDIHTAMYRNFEDTDTPYILHMKFLQAILKLSFYRIIRYIRLNIENMAPK